MKQKQIEERKVGKMLLKKGSRRDHEKECEQPVRSEVEVRRWACRGEAGAGSVPPSAGEPLEMEAP